MQKFLAAALVAALCNSQAATINFNTLDLTGAALTNTLRIQQVAPQAVGEAIVTGNPVRLTPNTNGTATASFQPGYYDLLIDGLRIPAIRFVVRADLDPNSTNAITALITNGVIASVPLVTNVVITTNIGGSTAAITAATNQLAIANTNLWQPKDADLTALAGISGVLGDVIVYGASGWTRLGVGAEGTVLKIGSGVPEWGADATSEAGSGIDAATGTNIARYQAQIATNSLGTAAWKAATDWTNETARAVALSSNHANALSLNATNEAARAATAATNGLPSGAFVTTATITNIAAYQAQIATNGITGGVADLTDATNYANLIGANSTSHIVAVAGQTTNFASLVVGAGATNEANRVGQNATSHVAAVSLNNTNFASSVVGAGGTNHVLLATNNLNTAWVSRITDTTNHANAKAADGTNFARYVIGAGATNEVARYAQPLDSDLTALAGISGVNGDVIIYNGGWARLAKSTDGKVLKLASGFPAWGDDSTGEVGSGIDAATGTNIAAYQTLIATNSLGTAAWKSATDWTNHTQLRAGELTNHANAKALDGTNFASAVVGSGATNHVLLATNNLNTALVSRITDTTNHANAKAADGTNFASSVVGQGATNHVLQATNNLNTALVSRIADTTNHANAKAADGTNHVQLRSGENTNYAALVVGAAATNHIQLRSGENTNHVTLATNQLALAITNTFTLKAELTAATNTGNYITANGLAVGAAIGAANAASLTNLTYAFVTNSANAGNVKLGTVTITNLTGNITLTGFEDTSTTHAKSGTLLVIPDGSTRTVQIPAYCYSVDGVRTYYVTNGTFRIFHFTVYANKVTNCASVTAY